MIYNKDDVEITMLREPDPYMPGHQRVWGNEFTHKPSGISIRCLSNPTSWGCALAILKHKVEEYKNV